MRYSWRGLAYVFLPAMVLFAIGGLTDISLPGVYMDAVNPDYVIVRLLNPAAAHMPVWFMPGTLLMGIFPVIVEIYHGALPYYIGLPVYLLFGTGVDGIRIANLVFGLLVLTAAGAFMLAFGVRRLIAGLCLALLALDSGFLFSFRTQFYITLLPVAALLWACVVIGMGDRPTGRRHAMLSGCLAGIAVYGYFIYGFLVPAVAAFAAFRWWGRADRRRLLGGWALGFAIGVSPYALGYFMMMLATGGPAGFVAYLKVILAGLAVMHSPMSVMQRADYFVYMVVNTLNGLGVDFMMFAKFVPDIMPHYKIFALVVLPVLAIIGGIWRPRRIEGLLLIAGFMAGFFVLVFCFGNRLWLHHAALVSPLLYIAFALTLEQFAGEAGTVNARRVSAVACILVTVPLIFANAAGRQAKFLTLEATGGVGRSSDAIDRFAQDALHDKAPPHMFFPDWGVFMSFAMITHGSIPFSTAFTPAAARAVLCSGQDAELVTMPLAAQPQSRIDDWVKAMQWGTPEASHYDQRDGTPVLDVLRWRAAARPAGGCG